MQPISAKLLQSIALINFARVGIFQFFQKKIEKPSKHMFPNSKKFQKKMDNSWKNPFQQTMGFSFFIFLWSLDLGSDTKLEFMKIQNL